MRRTRDAPTVCRVLSGVTRLRFPALAVLDVAVLFGPLEVARGGSGRAARRSMLTANLDVRACAMQAAGPDYVLGQEFTRYRVPDVAIKRYRGPAAHEDPLGHLGRLRGVHQERRRRELA